MHNNNNTYFIYFIDYLVVTVSLIETTQAEHRLKDGSVWFTSVQMCVTNNVVFVPLSQRVCRDQSHPESV